MSLVFELSNKTFRRAAGFTAVELLVVISIFTIMTGVVLANLPKFRDQSSVGLVAEQVSLVARQAQIYGNNARSFGGNYVPAYGLNFNKTTDAKSFVVFADKPNPNPGDPGNNTYNAGSGCAAAQADTECLEKFNFSGINISQIYACDGTNDPDSCDTKDNEVNVIFKRASYNEASFIYTGDPDPAACLKIEIVSTRDPSLTKEVVIYSTGHIFTRNPISDSC